MCGDDYRLRRSQAAWAIKALNHAVGLEQIGGLDWRVLAARVQENPGLVLTAIASLGQAQDVEKGEAEPVSEAQLLAAIDRVAQGQIFPRVLRWTCLDVRRVFPVPPEHWILLQDEVPFRAALDLQDGSPVQHLESIPANGGHIACIPPGARSGAACLQVERFSGHLPLVNAALNFLAAAPSVPSNYDCLGGGGPSPGQRATQGVSGRASDLVLLTNGRGAMARLCLDLGRVSSRVRLCAGGESAPHAPGRSSHLGQAHSGLDQRGRLYHSVGFPQSGGVRPRPPCQLGLRRECG